MIKDITLGQFYPGNSVIHKLDPRMKLILVVFYIVILFVMKSALSYLLATVFTLVLMILSKNKVKGRLSLPSFCVNKNWTYIFCL